MITFYTVGYLFLLQILTRSLFSLQKKKKDYDWGFMKKGPKPLIGFELMTYALPWRYSTTELKGTI